MWYNGRTVYLRYGALFLSSIILYKFFILFLCILPIDKNPESDIIILVRNKRKRLLKCTLFTTSCSVERMERH